MLILFHKQTESFSSPLEGFPGSQFWKSLSVRLDGSRLALLAGGLSPCCPWAVGRGLGASTSGKSRGDAPPSPLCCGDAWDPRRTLTCHAHVGLLSLSFLFLTDFGSLVPAVLSAGTKLKQRQEGNGGVWGQWGQGLMKQLVPVADVVQIWWGKVFKNKVIGKREKCGSKPGSLF